MKIKFYRNPKNVGWLGWIEAKNKKVIGFVRLNGDVQFGW